MDTKERAEKIVDINLRELVGDYVAGALITIITSQLDEAVREASEVLETTIWRVRDVSEAWEKRYHQQFELKNKAYAEGFAAAQEKINEAYKNGYSMGEALGWNAAREKAAGIAEHDCENAERCWTCYGVAERIWAMTFTINKEL